MNKLLLMVLFLMLPVIGLQAEDETISTDNKIKIKKVHCESGVSGFTVKVTRDGFSKRVFYDSCLENIPAVIDPDLIVENNIQIDTEDPFDTVYFADMETKNLQEISTLTIVSTSTEMQVTKRDTYSYSQLGSAHLKNYCSEKYPAYTFTQATVKTSSYYTNGNILLCRYKCGGTYCDKESHENPNYSRMFCPSGYRNNKSVCEKTAIVCPSGYTLSSTEETCKKTVKSCNDGYTLSGDYCIKSYEECPVGTTNVEGSCQGGSVECNEGFELTADKSSCEKTYPTCPEDYEYKNERCELQY